MIIRERKLDPTSRTYAKLARGLGVSRDWLENGTGTPPTPTGAIPPKPGAADIPAWQPSTEVVRNTDDRGSIAASVGAFGMDVDAKMEATHPEQSKRVSRTTDGDVDPCQSRRIVVAIARGTRMPVAVIDALLAETVSGDDPGEAYWKRRMYEHLDEINRIAKYISAGGADDRDGGGLR